jgi:hypothetical protein
VARSQGQQHLHLHHCQPSTYAVPESREAAAVTATHRCGLLWSRPALSQTL